MNIRSRQIKKLKNEVEHIWVNPKSRLLENHYKFIRKILQQNYPNIFSEVSPETIELILYNTIYLDRLLRRKRQGKQNNLKQTLAEQFKKEL